VKDDLPRLLHQAARPGLTLRLEKPFGEQSQVIEAIASAISSVQKDA
jgi:hypothetical protein